VLTALLPAGLPLVYNEARIASFWGKRPGELASRWTRFAAVSGKGQQAGRLAGAALWQHKRWQGSSVPSEHCQHVFK
jgi:hypothetical protein